VPCAFCKSRLRASSPVVASLAARGLATTSSLAASGGNGPVSGIVIGITAERMEMQNATGPATVAITDKIRVIRTVSGTVANLCRGQKAGLDSR
jgi:hypothetical protein